MLTLPNAQLLAICLFSSIIPNSLVQTEQEREMNSVIALSSSNCGFTTGSSEPHPVYAVTKSRSYRALRHSCARSWVRISAQVQALPLSNVALTNHKAQDHPQTLCNSLADNEINFLVQPECQPSCSKESANGPYPVCIFMALYYTL